jgi:hypothetical protein
MATELIRDRAFSDSIIRYGLGFFIESVDVFIEKSIDLIGRNIF